MSEEKNAPSSLKDGLDVDVLDSAKQNLGISESDYTEEQYAKLLKKIDRFLLPVMWVAYGVQQADKTGLSTQALFGLREDTRLVGQQYSWLTTIFYLAYLVCEFPSNYMMQRVSVGKTLAVLMFLWGVVVLCTAFAKNWAHLMLLRALQGAFECTISPSFLFIIASWYRTREHAFRSVIWGTANAGFGILCDLCMYGIGSAAQSRGDPSAWRGISYFLGAITITLSAFVWFFLGTPREVVWLSKEEKKMANARVLGNRSGTDKRREWKWGQVREAFVDPSTYFMIGSQIASSLANGGTTTFGSLVYRSFGFTSLETIAYNIPRDAFSIIFFLTAGYLSYRFKNIRFILMMSALVPGFVGMLAMGLLPQDTSYRWVKFGMYFMAVTVNVTGPLMWMVIPSNITGRTKKSAVSTILFIMYCTGNAIGAQMFRAKDAPRYVPAIIACAACYGTNFCIMFAWRTYYVYQNAQRDKRAAREGLSAEDVKERGILGGEADLTDRENVHFRYTY